jgi:hypothetical protein
MAGDTRRKRDDGGRTQKKQQNASRDVMARKSGNTEARPKTRGGAPRSMKSGR